MQVNGKNWLLLTNDYVWGHNTSKATRAIVEANGGKVVDELLVPQNTRDFAAYLLKIQQIKPDVVATAVGGDDIKALRQQVVQLEDAQAARPGSTTSRTGPTSTASGPTQIFGVFGTNWYYRLDLPGVKEFVAALPEAVPGHGDPGAGQRLLQRLHGDARAAARVEGAGTTNNIAVIKELEGLKVPARDRMQHYDAYMDPATHQCSRRSTWRRYNDAPAEKDDIFKILAQVAAAGRRGQGRGRAPASSSRWRRRRATSSDATPDADAVERTLRTT